MTVILGVNIDHAATVRQARREGVPDLAAVAAAAVAGGADGITIHLREDRRHIQDEDFVLLAPLHRLNLEMAVTPEMTAIACGRLGPRPHSACLVPERREEVTTEGGLDVRGQVDRVRTCTRALDEAGIVVSAFIEPDPWQIEAAARCGCAYVEFHTGRYAHAFAADGKGEAECERLLLGARAARRLGLRVNAGHGLTVENVPPILAMEGLEELNIGFSLVARALFVGLENAVREMKAAIAGGAR